MCIQNYVYSGKISCTGNFGKLISPADKTDATSLYLSAINISKVFLSTSCKLSLLFITKKELLTGGSMRPTYNCNVRI